MMQRKHWLDLAIEGRIAFNCSDETLTVSDLSDLTGAPIPPVVRSILRVKSEMAPYHDLDCIATRQAEHLAAAMAEESAVLTRRMVKAVVFSQLSTSEKAVALVLIHLQETDGPEHMTSMDNIASKANVSKSSAQKAVKGLSIRGIVRSKRQGASMYRWINSEAVFALEA